MSGCGRCWSSSSGSWRSGCFIQIFADIFHRRDLSGAGKAGWIVLIFILPFLGALIMIARPKMTEQDREDIQRCRRRSDGCPATRRPTRSRSWPSSATRRISAEEYEKMKAQALLEL